MAQIICSSMLKTGVNRRLSSKYGAPPLESVRVSRDRSVALADLHDEAFFLREERSSRVHGAIDAVETMPVNAQSASCQSATSPPHSERVNVMREPEEVNNTRCLVNSAGIGLGRLGLVGNYTSQRSSGVSDEILGYWLIGSLEFVPVKVFRVRARFLEWARTRGVRDKAEFVQVWNSWDSKRLVRYVQMNDGYLGDVDEAESHIKEKEFRSFKRMGDLRLRRVSASSSKGWDSFCYEVRKDPHVKRTVMKSFQMDVSPEQCYESISSSIQPSWRQLARSICYNRTAIDYCLAKLHKRFVQGAASSKPVPEEESSPDWGSYVSPQFVNQVGLIGDMKNLAPMMRVFVEAARVMDKALVVVHGSAVVRYGSVFRTFVGVVQLARALVVGDTVGACLALAALSAMPEVLTRAGYEFRTLAAWCDSKIGGRTVQGYESESGKRKGFFDALLFRKLTDFLKMFTLSTIFLNMPETAKTKFFNLGDFCRSVITEISLLESLVDFVKFLGERLMAFAESGKLSDLFGGDPNLEKLVIIEDLMLTLTSPKRTTLMLDDPSKWAEIVALSDKFTASLSDPNTKSNPALVGAIITLRKEIVSIRRGQSTSRCPPFACIIKGPPGIGKTEFVKKIENQVRASWNIPRDVTVTLAYQADSAHQIQPSLTLVVLVNDAFQTKDDKCPIPTLSLMQTLVDSTMFKAEGASLEEKERSLIAPEVVIFTTNASKYLCSSATTGADKVDRRYPVCDMAWTAKAEKLAVKGKYSVDLTHRYQSGVTGLVRYTVGHMRNEKDSTQINFDVAKVLFVTEEPSDVERWIFGERNRIKADYARGEEFEELCPHGLSLPCTCLDEFKVTVSLVDTIGDEDEEEYRAAEDTVGVQVIRSVQGNAPVRKTYEHDLEEEDSDSDQDENFPELSKNFYSFGGRKVSYYDIHKRIEFLEGNFVKCRSSFGTYSWLTKDESVWVVRDGRIIREGYMVKPRDYDIWPPPSFVDRYLEKWTGFSGDSLKVFKENGAYIGVGLLALATAALGFFKAMYPQASLHGEIVGVENVHSTQPAMLGVLPAWLGAPGKTPGILPTEVKIACRRGDMYCSFVALNVVMVPAHFFIDYYKLTGSVVPPELQPGEDFYVGRMQVKFNPKCLYLCKDRDLAFYFTSSVIGGWTTVYNFLPEGGRSFPLNARMNATDVTVQRRCGNELWYGPPCTVAGDCGKLLIGDERVVGVHVSVISGPGFQPVGAAVVVDKSVVDEAFAHYKTVDRYPVQLNQVKPQGYPTLCDESKVGTDMNWCLKLASEEDIYFADMTPLGCVKQREDPKMTCRPTTMHRVFASRCGEYVKARTGRAVPMLQPDGSTKYVSSVTRRFDVKVGLAAADPELMEFVVREAIGELPFPEFNLQPMTWYDALVGHPDNYLINAKDPSKSLGPLNSLQGRRPKMAFIPAEDGSGFSIATWYVRRMYGLEESIIAGLIPVMLIKGTLKDEAQTKEKFDIYKTRLFYVPESEFNLLLKKWLKPLMVHCMHNNKVTGFKIVINPGGGDWDDLADQLLQFGGRKLSDADENVFDLRHCPLIQYAILYVVQLAKKCGYTEEQRFVVGVLMEACFRCVLVLENVFYLCTTRLYSGLDITSFINCVFNTLINRSCAREAMRDLDIPDSVSVRAHMFDASNGDDLALAVSDELAVVMDGQYMVDHAASLGYVMTGGEKGESIPIWKSIHELVFVKRRFRFEEGRWKAPLALESIYKSLSYCLESSIPDSERDLGALQCAYKEIWFHGRETFNEFRDLCSLNGLLVRNYDEYQKSFDDGNFYPWLGETERNIQGKTDLLALRRTPCATDQLFLGHERGPHYTRLASGQGSPPTDWSLRKEGSWFKSSTELNNINTTIVTEEHTPVGKLAVGDGDVMDMCHVPPKLTRETGEQSLREYFARPRRILTFDVTTAASGSANVSLFSTWAALPGVAKIVGQYRFYRANATVKVVYSGNPSTLGYVRMVAVPVVEVDNYTAELQTLTSPNTLASIGRSSTLPHLDFDLSKPCSCELKLPFPSQFDYREIGVSDWTLFFFELGPMASADAAITPQAITFETYVYYENVEFLSLVPQGGEPGGPWESFLNYSSEITGMIPHPYTALASQILGTGAKVAKFFGWSRPPLEATDMAIVRKHGNTALCSGQGDMVYHTGTDPAVGSNTSWQQYPMGASDDMDVKKMIGMYAHLKTNWNGTVLLCEPDYLATSFSSGNTIYPTALAFATFLFSYWRGTLRYKMKIYSSPLIRWRVGFVVVPTGFAPPASFPGGGDYLTTVVDVCGTTEVEIDVPYLFKEPWRVPNGRAPVSSGAGTRIMYFSMCTPSGPGATTSTPLVEVWVKGGEDFELALPTLDVANLFRTSQGGRAAYNFGETIQSWGTLCKRPVTTMMGTIGGAGSGPWMRTPIDGIGPIDTATIGTAGSAITVNSSGWSYASYLRRAFLGYNGGTVHRYIFRDTVTNQKTFLTHVYQVPSFVRTTGSPAAPKGILGVGTGDVLFTPDDFIVEVGFPSRCTGNFKNTQKQDLLFGDTQECAAVYRVDDAGNVVEFTQLLSALDDFTMGGFLMIPALKVR